MRLARASLLLLGSRLRRLPFGAAALLGSRLRRLPSSSRRSPFGRRLSPQALGAAAVAALALLVVAGTGSADDGWGFRLTSPRGEVVDDGDELLIAIPGGRAWGIASGLHPVPDPGTTISVDIEVRDPHVAEAFLRIAYYARVTGRPRQIDVADSPLVRSGERARVEVRIDPPDGAVAYRARVLGRMASGVERSSAGAIAVRDLLVDAASSSPRPRRTRLIAEH